MFNFLKKSKLKNLQSKKKHSEEFYTRLEKLKTLKKKEVVYKGKFNKTHTAKDLIGLPHSTFRDGSVVVVSPNKNVSTAGRVMTKRDHGGIIFIDLKDFSGVFQIALTESALSEDKLNFIREFIDIGDFIGIHGEPFVTKRKTLAICVNEFQLLSKALNNLPSKHFGIEDTEIRYRKRYIDLLLNEEVFNRFKSRFAAVQAMREWLLDKDFIEVVTRTLLPVSGGATAEPFTTHHNALDSEYQLRISNELDLKMAVAGGFDKVFEFAIDFRNEGIDASHLQEFQMLEWYSAYKDYKDGIKYTKQLLAYTTKKVLGTDVFKFVDKDGKEHNISFEKDIPIISFKELLLQYGINSSANKNELKILAEEIGISKEEIGKKSAGGLLDDIYKKKVRPHLIKPIFITNYPVELLPLARINDEDSSVTDSFQLVVGSWEIVKGYSELVDPIQQREAFKKQLTHRMEGDKEAMQFNEEFLTAMEYGMPPICGFGMGIDRFVCLITGAKNLKETVLFPLLAPEK